MPDGARFERGGEFIEAGYDTFAAAQPSTACRSCHRDSRSPRARCASGRADAAHAAARGRACARGDRRRARHRRRRRPPRPTRSRAPRSSRSPACALLRRLEGTYTVELDRVSATWLSSAEQRRAAGTAEPSARLADGNDALAKAMASELGERVPAAPVARVRRDAVAAAGVDEPSIAPCWQSRLPVALGRCSRPCASAGATRGCSGASPQAARAARRAGPAAGRCRRSRPRSGRGRPSGVDGRRRRSQAASTPLESLAIRHRPRALARRPPGAAARARACAATRCSRAGGRRPLVRRLVCLPSARLVAARRRGRRSARTAASTWRASTPRRSSAERWKVRSGAARGRPPRCSQRLAQQRLTYVRSAIYTGDWLTGAGKPDRTRSGPTDRKPAPRSCGGAVQARHHPRQRRRAGPARRLSPCAPAQEAGAGTGGGPVMISAARRTAWATNPSSATGCRPPSSRRISSTRPALRSVLKP